MCSRRKIRIPLSACTSSGFAKTCKVSRMSEQAGHPAYVSMTYNLGRGRRQFHLRQQSSDEVVFKQVLEQQQYDLRRLRRVSELFEFVQRQEARGLRPLVVDAGAN